MENVSIGAGDRRGHYRRPPYNGRKGQGPLAKMLKPTNNKAALHLYAKPHNAAVLNC